MKMHEKNQQLKECIDLRACSYPNWYKKFNKITLKSICLPIPDEIVKYLLDEIIILPKECYSMVPRENTASGSSSVQCGSSLFSKGDESDDNHDDLEQPEFENFSKLITQKISELDGSVYIKTNWNSPKDAFWITAGQTMCCKDITDVYQLLKASSICKEDLNCYNLPVFESNQITIGSGSDDSDTPQTDTNHHNNQFLIFKKWHDIHPGTEFRCFVRNKRIIGISPRDWPQYHEYICSQRVNIINDIVTMFKEHIKPKFPLFDYVFDVVRDAKDCVSLLDFSPFNEKWCDSLAFEWNELTSDEYIDEEDDPEFRYLSTDCGIQPSKRNNYGIPKDVIDMFSNTAANQNVSNETSTTNNVPDENSSDPMANTLNDFINNRLENIFRAEPGPNSNESDDEIDDI